MSSLSASNIISPFHKAVDFIKAYRGLFTVAAVILFAAGLYWSISNLSIGWADISIGPAAIIFFIIGPLTLIYAALGLLLLGRVLKLKLKFWSAFRLAGAAQLAEALPIPGGAIVRTGALVQAGATTGSSAILVTATAALWISLASTGAAAAMIVAQSSFGIALLICSLGSSLSILWWIRGQAGTATMLLILLHRMTGLVLMAIRIALAFAVINIALSIDGAAVFSLAAIAGSASSIAPAGLGVSEAFAALMAGTVAVAPATAFLAIALNRVIGLSACGAITLVADFFIERKRVTENG